MSFIRKKQKTEFSRIAINSDKVPPPEILDGVLHQFNARQEDQITLASPVNVVRAKHKLSPVEGASHGGAMRTFKVPTENADAFRAALRLAL